MSGAARSLDSLPAHVVVGFHGDDGMQAASREHACPNAGAGADVGGIDAGRIASHITEDRGRDLRRIARPEPGIVAGQPRKISVFHHRSPRSVAVR